MGRLWLQASKPNIVKEVLCMSNKLLKFSFGTFKIEVPVMTGVYAKDLVIDIELAKKVVREKLLIQQGKSYPFLADVRHLKLATKEARDYFANEGVEGMTALAILVGSYITVVTTNLFITFSKPKVPTKAFMTREHALQWLDQFVDK